MSHLKVHSHDEIKFANSCWQIPKAGKRVLSHVKPQQERRQLFSLGEPQYH